MIYPAFADAMRTLVTGDDAQGESVFFVDAGPSSEIGVAGRGGLMEIWRDAVTGALDPKDAQDRGPTTPTLSPADGEVKVRWFVIEPVPDGVPKNELDAAARAAFAGFGAAHHITDQSRHSAMHETGTLDVICLLKGEASLILEGAETRLKPGNVVIQRGTNHAWVAHGGPALFLAVLIDRPLKRA